MRLLRVVLLATVAALLAGGGIVQRHARAQDSQVRIAAAKKATPKATPAKKTTPDKKTSGKKKPSTPASPAPNYASVPLAERVGIQLDLAWTSYYNGLIDGDFTDRSVAAVKAFQKDHNVKETGMLDAAQRALLAERSKAKQDQVGWRMIEDKATGAHLGLPTKQVSQSSAGSRGGTRWFSAQGQIQVETFRIREPGATLANEFEQQKKTPENRKLEVNLMRNDFFILSGTQGLKKFYVRAYVRNLEIRGITILWDPATEVIMDPVVVVMSSAFAPFPGTGLKPLMGIAQRRPVDYGTGIVVTNAGHILADRQMTDDCDVIEIAGRGDADRVAEDATAGLVLLRVAAARDLTPAPLVHEGTRGNDLTLVGIADPQAQNGGRAVSTTSAKRNGEGLQPAPPLGFSGAAALDAQGRLAGMVALKGPVLASAGAASVPPPQASLVPVASLRRFLDAQYVTPSTGPAGAEAIKRSLVRVICVRR